MLGDTLDFLKLQRFLNKVGSSTSHVKLEALPPSSAAAKFHNMRVYLHVQQWMGIVTIWNKRTGGGLKKVGSTWQS